MAIIIMLLLFTAVVFGLTAMLFFFKTEETRKQIQERDKLQRHKLYEITILKEIQDRIGYSLDIEKVIDVITGNLRYLFSYSSTACLVKKEGKFILKLHLEEPVSHLYVEQVRKSMLDSLTALEEDTKTIPVEDQITGVGLDDGTNTQLVSYFNIPLIVNNIVVGIINVSSARKSTYRESEVQTVYQIANQASTALTKLQEVLTIEKSKLMALIRSLSDGVFMVDTKSQILVINDAAKNLLQLTEKDPTFYHLASSFSEQLDIKQKTDEAINSRVVISAKELTLNNRIIDLSIVPVLKPHSTGVYFTAEQERHGVIGAAIILHDVTLEKNMAKMKEEFTNMMVHELRAPLSAIKDSAHIMITGGLEDEDKKKMLSIVQDQSTIMLETVTSLLDAAKVEAGRLSIQKAGFDLEQIVKDSLQVFKAQAAQKNVTIFFTETHGLPMGYVDKLRLSQVMNNLISNSLKYTNAGGSITVQVRQTTTSEAGQPAVPMLMVEVSDNGVGIPPEKQNSLFTKFSQIMHPTKQGEKAPVGTGLGLYITKGIVEAHGGTISLHSELNKGTTICFTVPIYKEQAKPEPAVSPHEPLTLPKPTVQVSNAVN